MKEKPTCRICFTKFTRRGNMLRHMEDIHGVDTKGLKKNESIKNWPGHHRIDSDFKRETSGGSLTRFDKEVARMAELTQLSTQYVNCSNLFQTVNNLGSMLSIP